MGFDLHQCTKLLDPLSGFVISSYAATVVIRATPLTRRVADEPFEHRCKMRLGLKADAQRDVNERRARLSEQLLRPLDPPAENELMRTNARGEAELRGEVHRA